MSLAARKSDRSTNAALRRALRARAQRGLREIEARGADASTHELRKRVKEVRGLLHLLRPGLQGGKALDRSLRDAARMLAPRRDLEVMLTTFDGLTARLRAPQDFAGLRWHIIDVARKTPASDQKAAIRNYSRIFIAFDTKVNSLVLRDKASRLMWMGILSTLTRAQALQKMAQHAANTDLDATPFHDWRKAVKQHWYQARFLEKIAPAKMKAHVARIDALGEILGDHNELDVLATFLNTRPDLSDTDTRALTIFNRHMMDHRRTLAANALLQAETALGTPPKRLVGRWQGQWRCWRKG